jgi:DNA-binding NtrC family response regulator
MSLKVAIFEDDKDVADLLKEMMERKDYVVTNFYSLKDAAWKDCDVVLGDYRNSIVSFKAIEKECLKDSIPLIAISGEETQYLPQLIKPFSIEELQSVILDQLMKSKKRLGKKEESKDSGFFSSIFKKSS